MLSKLIRDIHSPAVCTLLTTSVATAYSLQVCKYWASNFKRTYHESHQALEKVTCTVQQLVTHENQSTAYHRYMRDFAVLINLVRGSMLASVRLLLSRLNERKHQHHYNQLLKHINVVIYTTKLLLVTVV